MERNRLWDGPHVTANQHDSVLDRHDRDSSRARPAPAAAVGAVPTPDHIRAYPASPRRDREAALTMPCLTLWSFSRWLTPAAGDDAVSSTLNPRTRSPHRATVASQAATSVKRCCTMIRAGGTPASARASAASGGTQTIAAPLLSHWIAVVTSQTWPERAQRDDPVTLLLLEVQGKRRLQGML